MSDPKTIWRQRDKAAAGGLHIAVAGSMTCDPIEPYLGAYLMGRGMAAPTITPAPFGQIRQICDDYKSVLGSDAIDTLVLIWRLEDLFPAVLAKTLSDESALTALLDDLKAFTISIRKLRDSFDGTLIVSTPAYPSFPGFDLTDITPVQTYQAALDVWHDAMGELDNIRLLDIGKLVLQIGFEASHDARKWYLYRQPYSEILWQNIGRQTGRLIAAESLPSKKCIVLDCDNTLWGGIIGEDGLGGVALGGEFPGTAFRDFQKELMHLKSRGVLLAVASKNNSDDVIEMFDKHDAMILSRRDIAAFEVHWNSKVDSIRNIAKRLNIGTDSLVFIDDSAKEIDEVRQRLPDVTCFLVPEETADLPALLRNCDLFDKHDITAEDRNRTSLMHAEQSRQVMQETMSEAEFKQALDLKTRIFKVEQQHLSRITQLINKTNQFNLTTRRRTQNEVDALISAADTCVLGLEVSDKYGDYGLVGAAVLQKKDEVCDIDTLLMSCRVLGRGAESAFIGGIIAAARNMGCAFITGRYIPSGKNEIAQDLYKNNGFTNVKDAWQYTLPPASER